MIALFFTPPLVMEPGREDPAVELCKPALAHKADGEIATINVDSTKIRGSRTTITGRLTAFQRMGPAPAGSARTHHLIRFDFTYRCTVKRGRVREAAVNPLSP
jgi:hypothetical protein